MSADTEICLIFATVQALKDGYEAMFVTDAVGVADAEKQAAAAALQGAR